MIQPGGEVVVAPHATSVTQNANEVSPKNGVKEGE
jgi:hypothetical protein